MTTAVSRSSPFHLFISFFSFSCACIIGFYVHPLLLAILTDSVPRLTAALLHTQLTTPYLFLLLNLLVGALYVTSRMMPQGTRRQLQEDAVESNLAKETAGDPLSDDASPCDILSGAGRIEIQRKNVTNRSRRLARSKSDGILALAGTGKSPMGLRAVPPVLKKAGTFESAWHRRRRRHVKPVVVVADPPEDGQVAEEEVDKKAEEFIGRFYQRVKLQH